MSSNGYGVDPKVLTTFANTIKDQVNLDHTWQFSQIDQDPASLGTLPEAQNLLGLYKAHAAEYRNRVKILQDSVTSLGTAAHTISQNYQDMESTAVQGALGQVDSALTGDPAVPSLTTTTISATN
jgi:hypothetical protein